MTALGIFGVCAVVIIVVVLISARKEIKYALIAMYYRYLFDVGIARKEIDFKINVDNVNSTFNTIVSSISNDVFNGKYTIASRYYTDEHFNGFYKDMKYLYKLVKKNETLFYMSSKYKFELNYKDEYGNKHMAYSLFDFLDKDYKTNFDLLTHIHEWLLNCKNVKADDLIIIKGISINIKEHNKHKSKVNYIERRIYKDKVIVEEKPEPVENNLINKDYDATIDIIKEYNAKPITKEEFDYSRFMKRLQ